MGQRSGKHGTNIGTKHGVDVRHAQTRAEAWRAAARTPRRRAAPTDSGMQRRLRDVTASPRAQRALAHRSLFPRRLTWFEIHGGDADMVEKWKSGPGRGAGRGRGAAGGSSPSWDAGGDDGGGDAAAESGPFNPKRRPLRSSCSASRGAARSRSLMTGHAGSISLARKLNFGLRGKPWWLLWRPSPPVSSARKRRLVAVLSKFL